MSEGVGFQFLLEQERVATFMKTACGPFIRSLRLSLSLFGFLDITEMASGSPLMQYCPAYGSAIPGA